MSSTKYIFWVDHIDEDEREIHAVGNVDGDAQGLRYETSMHMDAVENTFGKGALDELMQMGRLFYIEEFNDGRNDEFTLLEGEDWTEEHMADIKKKAAEMSKFLNWDNESKSDSSND